jgi:hypothetical protein
LDVTVNTAVLGPGEDGSKVARSPQLWPLVTSLPAAQSVAAPARRLNSDAPSPPSAMAVRVTGWVPPLVTVDVRVAVGPSATFYAANVSATGVRESSVWVPVPVS